METGHFLAVRRRLSVRFYFQEWNSTGSTGHDSQAPCPARTGEDWSQGAYRLAQLQTRPRNHDSPERSRCEDGPELLRHANSRITMEIYQQSVSEEKRHAQDLVFGQLLEGKSAQHPPAPQKSAGRKSEPCKLLILMKIW